MKNFLKNLINPPIGIIILVYIISFGVWIVSYFFNSSPTPISGSIPVFFENTFIKNHFISYLVSFGITLLSSVLIVRMINKYSFIRTRSFLPTIIYLTLISSWIPIHGDISALFASLLVLLSVHMALGLYKMKNAVEPAFLLSFFLALASILMPEYIILIIFFWLGFFFLNCFSLRMFLASLFGYLVPFLLLFSTLYYFYPHNIITKFSELFILRFHLFEYESTAQLIYVLVIGIILVISLFQMFKNSNVENIQTRNELNFLKTIGFGLLLLFLFIDMEITSICPLIAVFYALLSSYSLTLKPNRFNTVLFILFLIANVFLLTFYII